MTETTKNITGMSKISAEDVRKSFEKNQEVSYICSVTESDMPKIVKIQRKKGFWQRFSFHRTIIGARWEGEPITYSWDFYLLPMLRYAYQGHAQYINFRWLIWSIDFKVK